MTLSRSDLKHIRSLTLKKFRDEHRQFLLEGWRALREALDSAFRVDLVVVATGAEEASGHRAVLDGFRRKGIRVEQVKAADLDRVAPTVHSQGVVAVVAQKEFSLSDIRLDGPETVLALDAVSDPGNVGSVIRTADWFGARGVVLGSGSASLYNDKVVRASAGSLFHLPIIGGVDLLNALDDLKQKGTHIVGTAMDGTPMEEKPLPSTGIALVLGSEASGLSKHIRSACDRIISIPPYGRAESLNVAVAAGIVLWHLRHTVQGPSDDH